MSPSRFLRHSFENSIFSLLQVSIIGIRFSHQNMLLYTQETKDKNAVDKATATVDEYVSGVIRNKRAGDAAMTFGHKPDKLYN